MLLSFLFNIFSIAKVERQDFHALEIMIQVHNLKKQINNLI